MIAPKAPKQPKQNAVVTPKGSPGNVTVMPDVHPPHHKIRERAYELYESRGRKPGQDEQDWLRAEQEILKP
ncbi:MAG TPA: DUF2934 domain-containing protein [Candidatus Sulfotelmatobacter sp.]|nr:DUF2934 domain-containing protein [Candidatus Sulfotelmatobacter sp.]